MFTLTSEIAQHYLEIIKLLNNQWILQGPLTSHSWLRLSSTPYYLFFPIFALFRFHPMTLSYFWIITSILIIPLNYFVIKKVLDNKTAIISTLLIVTSPLFINLIKLPSFFNFIIPLFYFLLLAIHSKRVWLVFFIISLMFSLHASALILLLFFIGVFLLIKKLDRKQIAFSSIAYLIPQIPFFINDFYSGFSMTKNLILWIPYKAFNFLTGKTLGLNNRLVADETIKSIFNFIKLSFLPDRIHWITGMFILLLIIVYFRRKKTIFVEKVLYYLLIFGLLILMIHKNPPLHYFIPIYFIPLILLSKILSLIKNKFLILILLFLISSNLYSIFNKKKMSSEFIPYKTQEKVAKTIIKDSKGKKFSLLRKGPFDNYTDQFKQNYEYILWWLGNRPVKDSKLEYLIVEKEKYIKVFRNRSTILKTKLD